MRDPGSGTDRDMSFNVQEIRELREGRYVIIDDEPCKIVSITTSKPGKHGSAKANLVAMGLWTGQKRTITAPVTDKVQVPMIDRRQAQVVSVHGSTVQLMDLETYQMFELEIPSEFEGQLQAGADISYMEALGRRMITRA